MIKVKYKVDCYGCLTMTPVSRRLQTNIAKYLGEWKVKWSGFVFVQQDADIADAIRDFTAVERKDLNDGWTVIKKVDLWEWLHYVGWDAHEGIDVVSTS